METVEAKSTSEGSGVTFWVDFGLKKDVIIAGMICYLCDIQQSESTIVGGGGVGQFSPAPNLQILEIHTDDCLDLNQQYLFL